MFEFLRTEPLYHYPMDRFSLKSPILYRPEHKIVHVGGGPNRNHPQEINLNVVPMSNVDILATAERLPFADASIDVVISCAVLEHVQSLSDTLAEIRRVLKPGGFVYIEIPFIQPYHTHDGRGVRFEDYRRLTKPGLTEAFDFCTPLDVGCCVGPISTVNQVAFALLRELRTEAFYRRTIDRLYHFVGNLIVWLDGRLSDDAIQRSIVPSGLYYFGRKHDQHAEALAELPRLNSMFPRDIAGQIRLLRQTPERLELQVTNTSRTTWLRAALLGWGTVHLGMQRIRGTETERDFRRLDLPGDIGPGESFTLSIDLGEIEGADGLAFDLVNEGMCWFADRGGQPLVVKLPPARQSPPVARTLQPDGQRINPPHHAKGAQHLTK